MLIAHSLDGRSDREELGSGQLAGLARLLQLLGLNAETENAGARPLHRGVAAPVQAKDLGGRKSDEISFERMPRCAAKL